ncbi:MAG: putative bifunctional diguanylate cyclase/phosphodiesterase [Bacillota bacterium]
MATRTKPIDPSSQPKTRPDQLSEGRLPSVAVRSGSFRVRRAVFGDRKTALAALLVAVVLVGVIVARAVKDARTSLIQRAMTGSAMLDTDALKHVLTLATGGRLADIPGDPGYLLLKSQLRVFRDANSDCRAVYLLTELPGGPAYLADAVDEAHPEHRPLGASIGDVPSVYAERLRRGEPILALPTVDVWGVWVSAVAPVFDEKGVPVAAFGVDLAVGDWAKGLLPYVLSAAGGSMLFVGLFFSTLRSGQKRVEDELRFMATHDHLTGLPNRLALEQYLGSLHPDQFAGSTVAILDVDNFKVVNDSFTHNVGDTTLVRITETIKGQLRGKDFIARLGGDEFAIVFPGTPLPEAGEIARQIREAVQGSRVAVGSDRLDLTISIGLAEIGSSQDADVALSHADMALFAAKRTGRNRIVVYDRGLPAERTQVDAQRMVPLIKRALAGDTLVLHLQPIIEAGTGDVLCYEVLSRIRNEEGELVYPGDFLPVAERFGLISELDRRVVRETVSLLEKRPDLTLFVNVSQTSASDRDFLEFIRATLRATPVEPSRLGFEITESAAARDTVAVREWVSALKELGCPIALDDFGTGYSSFLRLGSLPVDFLKIDGAFVKDMDTDPTHRVFVQAMNDMAHAVGKKTVAEFVENEKIQAMITELGIDYGQGYGLGKPAPVDHWETTRP